MKRFASVRSQTNSVSRNLKFPFCSWNAIHLRAKERNAEIQDLICRDIAASDLIMRSSLDPEETCTCSIPRMRGAQRNQDMIV